VVSNVVQNDCVFSTVSNQDLRNVALNKPSVRSYQVSTLTDQSGAHPAILANDGNRQTCARSLSATNPWWTVDLGDPTLVIRVDLTSSGDAAGTDRGFTVILFDIFPHKTYIRLHKKAAYVFFGFLYVYLVYDFYDNNNKLCG